MSCIVTSHICIQCTLITFTPQNLLLSPLPLTWPCPFSRQSPSTFMSPFKSKETTASYWGALVMCIKENPHPVHHLSSKDYSKWKVCSTKNVHGWSGMWLFKCIFPFLHSYINLQKKMGVEHDRTYVLSGVNLEFLSNVTQYTSLYHKLCD